MGLNAPAANGKNVLVIYIAAGPDAEFAEDAPVEVDDGLGVGGIYLAAWIKMSELRCQHAAVIGHSLELAVAALLASRADVVAFDEEHL